MQKSSPLKTVLGIFVVWRAAILIAGFFAISFFPKIMSGSLVNSGQVFNFFSAWANWDGGHYLSIAKDGYQIWFQYAFFPLYPILISLTQKILGSYLFGGLFISNLTALGSAYYFFKLSKLDFNQQTSIRSLIYFLIFPSAFFLVALYSESLFLFLVISSFYFARRANFLASNSLAAFALIARPVGFLLFISLVFEYLYQKKFKLNKIGLDFASYLIPVMFLAGYLYFLNATYQDPLIFIKAQTFWQRGVTSFPFKVIFENLYQVISLKNLGTSIFSSQLIDLSAFLIFFVCLIWGIGKIRLSYAVFGLLVILTPLVSGSLASMSRFVLAAFGGFLVLGQMGKNELFDKFLIIIFVLLQAILMTLFLNGFWVA